jgi:hypothetical protein
MVVMTSERYRKMNEWLVGQGESVDVWVNELRSRESGRVVPGRSGPETGDGGEAGGGERQREEGGGRRWERNQVMDSEPE